MRRSKIRGYVILVIVSVLINACSGIGGTGGTVDDDLERVGKKYYFNKAEVNEDFKVEDTVDLSDNFVFSFLPGEGEGEYSMGFKPLPYVGEKFIKLLPTTSLVGVRHRVDSVGKSVFELGGGADFQAYSIFFVENKNIFEWIQEDNKDYLVYYGVYDGNFTHYIEIEKVGFALALSNNSFKLSLAPASAEEVVTFFIAKGHVTDAQETYIVIDDFFYSGESIKVMINDSPSEITMPFFTKLKEAFELESSYLEINYLVYYIRDDLKFVSHAHQMNWSGGQ